MCRKVCTQYDNIHLYIMQTNNAVIGLTRPWSICQVNKELRQIHLPLRSKILPKLQLYVNSTCFILYLKNKDKSQLTVFASPIARVSHSKRAMKRYNFIRTKTHSLFSFVVSAKKGSDSKLKGLARFVRVINFNGWSESGLLASLS